jgi:hemerythrin-like domain-containing protein
MNSTPDPTRPDVSEMYAVHQVLRDTLDCAPQLVAAVDAGDTARVELISNFYENVLSFLHVHHEGEEQLIFPLLRERCPEEVVLVEEMASQHAAVVELVGRSHEALAAWAGGESSAQRASASSLGDLGQRLEEHLSSEESDLLPLCADHLSLAEWGALPGHALGSFDGDKVWLILGLIRDQMSQAQRDMMLAHMPPPAVDMWTNMGEQAYKNLVAEVGPPIG